MLIRGYFLAANGLRAHHRAQVRLPDSVSWAIICPILGRAERICLEIRSTRRSTLKFREIAITMFWMN